jgi:hypothetical protein
MHVFSQSFTKRDSVRRKSAALVPLNCNSLSNRFAAMGHADDLQSVSVRSLKRGNDRYTTANFGQSKQRVRCATLQQDIGPDVCEAASCVEQPPDGITRVQQQQRISGKVADIYNIRLTETEGLGSDS